MHSETQSAFKLGILFVMLAIGLCLVGALAVSAEAPQKYIPPQDVSQTYATDEISCTTAIPMVYDPDLCDLTISYSGTLSIDPTPADGLQYSWNFGDGGTSDTASGTHTYSAPGQYTVTLTVTDPGSGPPCNTHTNSLVVMINTKPQVDFVADRRQSCAPFAVTFTDLSVAETSGLEINRIVGWRWDFGDGSTSPLSSTTHTYMAPGTYNVSLIVTDLVGCMSVLQKEAYITVNRPPVPSFTASPSSGCDPLIVQFNDTSTAGDYPIVGWSWNFGDQWLGGISGPTIGTGPMVIHHYLIPGTYWATLTVTDSQGCSVTSPPTEITVHCNPVAVATDFAVCLGTTLSPQLFMEHGAACWSCGVMPIYDFSGVNTNVPGVYEYVVTCATEFCVSSDVGTITVYAPPEASFSATPRSCCATPLLTVQFTDESTPGYSGNLIRHWLWDFGDGRTSTLQNPSHDYAPGVYSVTLTVTDAFGCSSSIQEALYITAHDKPRADFDPSLMSCCPPVMMFTDRSSQGASPSDPIVAWEWDLDGNGTFETPGQGPQSASYPSGSYAVSLHVTDGHGCSDVTTIRGYTACTEPPIPNFDAMRSGYCLPLTVHFIDTTRSGRYPITGWLWDFGDGATSTISNPVHIYQTVGTFKVTLTVTDSQGCVMTREEPAYISASQPPTANFDSAPVSDESPTTIMFTDLSTPGTYPITTWLWDFGDGETSGEKDPIHTYRSAGTFVVTLTVMDRRGCSSTVSEPVTFRTGTLVVNKIVDWNQAEPIPGQTFTICVSGPWIKIEDVNPEPVKKAALKPLFDDEDMWCQEVVYPDQLTAVFDGLVPGIYLVDEQDPGVEWGVTSNGIEVLVPGPVEVTVTITNTYRPRPACISGRVWNDLNEDGIQDPNEPGLPGVPVYLYRDTIFEPGQARIQSSFLEASTVSDDLGEYHFCDLRPGAYFVVFQLQPGFLFSPENEGSDDCLDSDAEEMFGDTETIVAHPGQNVSCVDAGMFLSQGHVTVYDPLPWHDPICAGWKQRYTLSFVNDGPVPLTNVMLFNLLPDVCPVQCDVCQWQGGWEYDDCSPGYVYYGYPGFPLIMWYIGEVEPGEIVTRYVEIRLWSNVPEGEEILSWVYVYSDQTIWQFGTSQAWSYATVRSCPNPTPVPTRTFTPTPTCTATPTATFTPTETSTPVPTVITETPSPTGTIPPTLPVKLFLPIIRKQ